MLMCVDPGHGGSANKSQRGIEANGIFERHLTLELGIELAGAIQELDWGVDILMTRCDDRSLTWAERKAVANQADFVLSIHVNAGPATARGARAFYWDGNEEGRQIADVLAHATPSTLRNPRHTLRPISSHQTTRDPAGEKVLAYPAVRAVLSRYRPTSVLYEVGFATNEIDAIAMKQIEIKRGLVAAMLAATCEALSILRR